MKITGVRFIRVSGKCLHEGAFSEERLVRPIDIYPEFKSQPTYWPVYRKNEGPPYPVSSLFMFIDTDEGISGMYGSIGMNECRIISGLVSGILKGENPHAVERIWDKMYRHAIHGRKGETMMAISKIDLALWDLKGKLLDAPVYKLLGGPSREKTRAYASMLGYSIEPEMAAKRAKEVVEQGYTATKWFFRHGPTDGPEGIRKNLELIRTIREAVGYDVDIMFDAWSSWDVPYTQRMAALASEYNPWWFEEPVLADMIPQYAELRRSIPNVLISGGEHEYTRWGIKALLDAGAVDILQPDPTWAGGLTEMSKICALASAHGIPVIPHHGGIASTHLIASQTITTCPIQEWLIQAGIIDNVFMKHKLLPINGYIQLPERPGLGMELDEDAIESREEIKM
ncbi:mandelate racemase/muconate lactonizing protein [Candidatus Poribacteria bacterium]|nr:mandelate racemase/muconate lactonizing protein [Candidatus Poribacteria bacterium]